MNTQPDNHPGYTPNHIATRWLRERDEARDRGDQLAGMVSAFLRGDVTEDHLIEATNHYDNPRFWVLHEGSPVRGADLRKFPLLEKEHSHTA